MVDVVYPTPSAFKSINNYESDVLFTLNLRMSDSAFLICQWEHCPGNWKEDGASRFKG